MLSWIGTRNTLTDTLTKTGGEKNPIRILAEDESGGLLGFGVTYTMSELDRKIAYISDIGKCKVDPTAMYLCGLYVSPTAIRQGVGGLLLELLLEYSAQLGAKQMWVCPPRTPDPAFIGLLNKYRFVGEPSSWYVKRLFERDDTKTRMGDYSLVCVSSVQNMWVRSGAQVSDVFRLAKRAADG